MGYLDDSQFCRKCGRKRNISGMSRAGIIWSNSRCTHMMRKRRLATRIGAGAGVFMAGVLQYLTSELLELSGEVCLEKKNKLIKPKHMSIAIRGDEELSKLMASTQISSGGHMQNIQKELFPKNKV